MCWRPPPTARTSWAQTAAAAISLLSDIGVIHSQQRSVPRQPPALVQRRCRRFRRSRPIRTLNRPRPRTARLASLSLPSTRSSPAEPAQRLLRARRQSICVHHLSTGSTTGGAELALLHCPQRRRSGHTSGYVTLTGSSAITAPLAAPSAPTTPLFFVSTAGDNEIHYISIPPGLNAATPPTDTQQISPNLPACTPVADGGTDAGCINPNACGTVVPATAIAVKPRSTT